MQQPWWIGALCVLSVAAAAGCAQAWLALRLRRRLRASGCDSLAALVGRTAVVEQAMPPGGLGQVILTGTVWMARNAGTRMLPAGLTCQVVKMDHQTLWVNGDP